MRKDFYRNVLPAMFAFAFSGLYAIVDGWFIGQNVGDLGIAGINLAYPITSFIQALGTGIGLAGAIQIGIALGSNDHEDQAGYLKTTVCLLIVASLVAFVLLFKTYPQILTFFGAQGRLFDYAADYIRIIILFSIFQIMATGLVPIIRNYGGTLFAMVAMITGFITNVILDGYFVSVLKLGTAGAGYATIIGQALTMLLCVGYMFKHVPFGGSEKIKVKMSSVVQVLKVSLSPFGLILSPNLMIIVLNQSAIQYGGDIAAASYGVICYVVFSVQLLLQGIGDGCQPLISRYYGNDSMDKVHEIVSIAIRFALGVALTCMVILYSFRLMIPGFFGASEEVALMIAEVMPLFLLGLIPIAFLRVSTSYAYATRDNHTAYRLIYSEPILTTVLLLWVLPGMFGLKGVWLSVPLAQYCVLMYSIVVYWKQVKQYKHDFHVESN
ncbi:multidrug transporter MATE [Erysipelothrix rhusiopathiae]|uniref:MATE family efflux transporter n=1 Tax=Erysipelothrix rhusiopathiae TaxID=1648 RepID=UPI001EDFCA14|nr:MATE family efflux transporter [Erysipelothrix rhusiopathiae]MCG4456489.1 multidrug transporter MATE [Erysipelothrix rhusiopathiae]